MDTNGNLFSQKDFDLKTQEEKEKMLLVTDVTKEQLARGKVRPNEKCPCGSGVKFKKCRFTIGTRCHATFN